MKASVATPTEIKIRLLQRGTSIPQIARELGVTPEAVRATLKGKARAPRMVEAITSALGWPERRIWSGAVPQSRKARAAERVA